MGKSVGDDFREAKVTLPIILAYARADDEARRFWTRVIGAGTQAEGDLQQAIAYVEKTGGIPETRERARALCRSGVHGREQNPLARNPRRADRCGGVLREQGVLNDPPSP